MKCSLSGNTWSGSSWDGKSKYAKKCADQNLGYKVFDADGKVVYEPKAAEPAVKVPFLVKVSIKDLNIRKGPGTDFDRVRFIEPGVYTIMEVRSGKGSSAGWGRLKSGIGWLSLDQTVFLHIGIDISRKIDIIDVWIRLKYLKHYQMKHGSALLSG
jgi:hypothetical protein